MPNNRGWKWHTSEGIVLLAVAVIASVPEASTGCEDCHDCLEANNQPASCAQLADHCFHEGHGVMIRANCPRSCGLCDDQGHVANCRDCNGCLQVNGQTVMCPQLRQYCNHPWHQETIQAACPATCGQCTSPPTPPPTVAPTTCEDNAAFKDAHGYKCSEWAGYRCSGKNAADAGLNPSQIDDVRHNCPVSCGLCGGLDECVKGEGPCPAGQLCYHGGTPEARCRSRRTTAPNVKTPAPTFGPTIQATAVPRHLVRPSRSSSPSSSFGVGNTILLLAVGMTVTVFSLAFLLCCCRRLRSGSWYDEFDESEMSAVGSSAARTNAVVQGQPLVIHDIETPELREMRKQIVGEAFLGEPNSVPSSFLCPITAQVMVEPVVASDGHTYEKIAIEKWLQHRGTSPMTNLTLSNHALMPNYCVRSAIQEYFEDAMEKHAKESGKAAAAAADAGVPLGEVTDETAIAPASAAASSEPQHTDGETAETVETAETNETAPVIDERPETALLQATVDE